MPPTNAAAVATSVATRNTRPGAANRPATAPRPTASRTMLPNPTAMRVARRITETGGICLMVPRIQRVEGHGRGAIRAAWDTYRRGGTYIPSYDAYNPFRIRSVENRTINNMIIGCGPGRAGAPSHCRKKALQADVSSNRVGTVSSTVQGSLCQADIPGRADRCLICCASSAHRPTVRLSAAPVPKASCVGVFANALWLTLPPVLRARPG